jgi:hypothetical protein
VPIIFYPQTPNYGHPKSLKGVGGNHTSEFLNAGSQLWFSVYIGYIFQHYMMLFSLRLLTWYQFTIAMLK